MGAAGGDRATAVRRWAAPLGCVAAAVSLAGTLVVHDRTAGSPSVAAIAEPLALLILIFGCARWAIGRIAVVAVLAGVVAVGVMVLRYVEGGTVLAVTLWSSAGVAAAALGLALRSLAQSREAAQRASIADRRLAIARDLHDFAAHDVSEVIAYAQAATMLRDRPAELQRVLERIEAAGRRCLESMEEAVLALPGGTRDATLLPELVERFNDSPGPRVELVAPTLDLPEAASRLVYRAVTESLTNLRKHATAATRAVVQVQRTEEHIVVEVTDDGADAGTPSAPGRGLTGLLELAESAGGSLQYGPSPSGWRVRMVLPASERPLA